jgi:hypothetical protein
MKGINNNEQIDAIPLYFVKALDKVPHLRLFHKLEHYGVRGRLLIWIEDFLTERSQEVIINGVKSTPTPVSQSVPQGSVLGHLLFLVYINDIAKATNSNSGLFADACFLHKTVKR